MRRGGWSVLLPDCAPPSHAHLGKQQCATPYGTQVKHTHKKPTMTAKQARGRPAAGIGAGRQQAVALVSCSSSPRLGRLVTLAAATQWRHERREQQVASWCLGRRCHQKPSAAWGARQPVPHPHADRQTAQWLLRPHTAGEPRVLHTCEHRSRRKRSQHLCDSRWNQEALEDQG